uniref:Uncharacterized protein n=1 Tax=Vespula pensylvanica TaxID=30213 RepID=A0A834UH05_VESPE|nr:hypothetical protein H0235_001687 [Vespula pensylvanica]
MAKCGRGIQGGGSRYRFCRFCASNETLRVTLNVSPMGHAFDIVVCHVKRVRKDEEEKTVKSRRTNHTGVQNRCILKQGPSYRGCYTATDVYLSLTARFSSRTVGLDLNVITDINKCGTAALTAGVDVLDRMNGWLISGVDLTLTTQEVEIN